MIVIDEIVRTPAGRLLVGEQFLLQVKAHDAAQGTIDNPIEYKHMMDVTAGLYYKYSKSIWLCLKSKSPCLIFPGTAPSIWEKAKNI